MTVEERAQDVMSIFPCMRIETIDGQVLTGVDLTDRITQALCDQIEECAKILDEEAGGMYGLATDSQQKEHWETASAARMAAKKLTKIAAEIRARSNGGQS